ncbi:ABC transporter substrate-binding protein [Alkalihalobacterium bogoriense]|uniref:ABC transporter substrate-binding protein n=1 Tax=Alkalihalobacterium bogoriense TaxID=246272 RepID=UPI00047B01DC|nr:extracellular solute-binding protein [Alkalihalobacterium bogoriense]
MRKLKMSLAALLSVFVIAACNGGGDETPADQGGDTATGGGDGEAVSITFWEFGNTGYDVLAAEYMEANPHVSIEIQNIDMNDLHDNLFTTLSAGSGAPDLTMIEVNEIERYRDAQDRFHNLNDYGASDVQDNFLDWVWNTGSSPDGDFVFGLPTDIGPTVMYYRTDVMEQAGIGSTPEEVQAAISTWEDFENVAALLAEEGILMADGAELVYNARRDQAKEQYFNTDDEFIAENNDIIREAYDYTANLIQQGYVGDIELWTPEWFSGMADGSYGVLLAPAWMQGVIKDNAPEPEGIWSITTMPEGAGNWGGSYLAIPAESDVAEEAYNFAEWLTAPEQQFKAFQGYGLFPSAPAVYDEPEFQSYTDDYFGGIETARIFSEAAQAVEPVYKGRNFYLVNDEIQEALTRIHGGGDVDEEWDAAMQRAKQRLERQ